MEQIFIKSNNTRFEIHFKFNQKLINLIKTFKTKNYNKDTQTWSIANQEYLDFSKKVKQEGYQLENEENFKFDQFETYLIIIKNNSNQVEISLDKYSSEAVDIIKAIPFKKNYLSETKKWYFSINNKQEIIEHIQESIKDIHYIQLKNES